MIIYQFDFDEPDDLNDDDSVAELADYLDEEDGVELYGKASFTFNLTDYLCLELSSSDGSGRHEDLVKLLGKPVRVTIETIEEV